MKDNVGTCLLDQLPPPYFSIAVMAMDILVTVVNPVMNYVYDNCHIQTKILTTALSCMNLCRATAASEEHGRTTKIHSSFRCCLPMLHVHIMPKNNKKRFPSTLTQGSSKKPKRKEMQRTHWLKPTEAISNTLDTWPLASLSLSKIVNSSSLLLIIWTLIWVAQMNKGKKTGYKSCRSVGLRWFAEDMSKSNYG